MEFEVRVFIPELLPDEWVESWLQTILEEYGIEVLEIMEV